MSEKKPLGLMPGWASTGSARPGEAGVVVEACCECCSFFRFIFLSLARLFWNHIFIWKKHRSEQHSYKFVLITYDLFHHYCPLGLNLFSPGQEAELVTNKNKSSWLNTSISSFRGAEAHFCWFMFYKSREFPPALKHSSSMPCSARHDFWELYANCVEEREV